MSKISLNLQVVRDLTTFVKEVAKHSNQLKSSKDDLLKVLQHVTPIVVDELRILKKFSIIAKLQMLAHLSLAELSKLFDDVFSIAKQLTSGVQTNMQSNLQGMIKGLKNKTLINKALECLLNSQQLPAREAEAASQLKTQVVGIIVSLITSINGALSNGHTIDDEDIIVENGVVKGVKYE